MEIATTSYYIGSFIALRDNPLPYGHEAMQGYLDGTIDVTNELKRFMKKFPELPEPYRRNLLDLIENRDKYVEELNARWDHENPGSGYKGFNPEG
ncbi:hypothetical protein KTO58_19325 [Chitinophaga pendula]|uniref:hypothetical protein n=1 Tax=Chitinophaga TaxID=79328 RepID=UPI0012FD7114|nr:MULTISPECIES: hypothetical protein [Chitinophaga]UCJ05827.1 hypothetical protein KTO58_19325 [Chitinophaga pendula]